MSRSSNWDTGWINSKKFWNLDIIKNLSYTREQFNDTAQLDTWGTAGHQPRTGALFDMRNTTQPDTTQQLIAWATRLEHVGISYYRMTPGDNLPYHSDTYKKYIDIFNLQGRTAQIWRYIFFVEDWKPGHIFEIDGCPFSGWKAGDWVSWRYDVPHMAANLGHENRYTIQLTGVEIESI